MNDYLTITEVANLTNRSYQNISQRAKTSLSKYLVEIDGKKMLKKDVLSEFNLSSNEEVFKSEIKAEIKADLNDNLNDSSIPLHRSEEDELKELIKELREEVKKKDEIIILKDEQLQKQTEQIIDLSNRVVELFENSQKLQLQTSFLLSGGNSENVEANEEGARAYEEVVEDKPKRKGLFSRFFK